MSQTAPNVAEPSFDDIQRMRFRKALQRKKRREREAEDEVGELNLTAMVDMMTIILVFLLKSFSASTVSMSASQDLKPPVSTTRQTPKDTVAVTITPTNIMVADKAVVKLVNGEIPKEALSGRLVAPLDAALKKEVDKLKMIARYNPNAPFNKELSVIGDKRIPYDLLLTVLYTAGQNELQNYRFVVVQSEGSSAE